MVQVAARTALKKRLYLLLRLSGRFELSRRGTTKLWFLWEIEKNSNLVAAEHSARTGLGRAET